MASVPQHAYVPVIKGKRNDLIAFAHASNEVKALMKPLVELMPVNPKDSIDDHIKKFVRYLATYLQNQPVTVDMYGFLPGAVTSLGEPAVVSAFGALSKVFGPFTPCYGFQRDDAVWIPLRSIIHALGKGLALRVDSDDLDDSAEDTWVQIYTRVKQLGLLPAEVDILIDLRNSVTGKGSESQKLVADFLKINKQVGTFRSVAILGSSALKTVVPITKDGKGEVHRDELDVWFGLAKTWGLEVPLIYGDYGVIHPEFTDVGPNLNANAKIRYTHGDKIIYFRGHKLFKPSDFPQYRGLAKKVIGAIEYRGPTFSYGDRYVFECAHGLSGTGNMGTWVMVDMNHHLEVVARQSVALRHHAYFAPSTEPLNKILVAV